MANALILALRDTVRQISLNSRPACSTRQFQDSQEYIESAKTKRGEGEEKKKNKMINIGEDGRAMYVA